MITLQELIDLLSDLNEGTRVLNSDVKAGLFIEIKSYGYYKKEHNVDLAEKLFELLDENGLGQIATC